MEENANEEGYNCVMHALGLIDDELVRAISACKPLREKPSRGSETSILVHPDDIVANTEFLDWLVGAGALHRRADDQRRQGDLVVYFDQQQNRSEHVGKLVVLGETKESDQVESKIGSLGSLREHDALDDGVVNEYGSDIRFYVPIDPGEARRQFVTFARCVADLNDKTTKALLESVIKQHAV